MEKEARSVSMPSPTSDGSNAVNQTSKESTKEDIINQDFDSYTGDHILNYSLANKRPSLPPLPKKSSLSKNIASNRLSLTVLPSITQQREMEDTQTCEMFLLTLAMSVEACLPPVFYERIFDLMEEKYNVKLTPQLLNTARTLLFEDEDQWNQLRDDEMINLIQLWKNKNKERFFTFVKASFKKV